jgi:hypothetical protein
MHQLKKQNGFAPEMDLWREKNKQNQKSNNEEFPA